MTIYSQGGASFQGFTPSAPLPPKLQMNALTSCNLSENINYLVHHDVAAITFSKVLQQATMLHQLCDDVDGFHQSTNGIKLEQVGMAELLHYFCFCNKVLYLHSACIIMINMFMRL